MYNGNSPELGVGGFMLPSNYGYGSLGDWGNQQAFGDQSGWGSGPAVPQTPQQKPWSWLDSQDANGVKTQGVLQPGLGVANGIFNAWMGMKQYGLAKQQLAEGKQQFALNYDAQRTTTNSQLEDRQKARVASNPGAYESVGSYMTNNGIKGRG